MLPLKFYKICLDQSFAHRFVSSDSNAFQVQTVEQSAIA